MTGQTVHASCVAFGDHGVLLRGPSGAGKSDLALRLIDAGAVLVADDRVTLHRRDAGIFAAAPPALAGRLEVRGIGLVELPYRAETALRLVCDLVPAERTGRLPHLRWCEYLEVRIRCLDLAPFEISVVAKLRLAVYGAAGQADPATGARADRGTGFCSGPDEQVRDYRDEPTT